MYRKIKKWNEKKISKNDLMLSMIFILAIDYILFITSISGIWMEKLIFSEKRSRKIGKIFHNSEVNCINVNKKYDFYIKKKTKLIFE